MPELEIAVTSASAARVAVAHGADRVELCTALELGGVTPSQALIDAAAITAQGAAGVVIGALCPDGRLDLETVARIAGAARRVRPDVAVTVHRAVDAGADPVAAITELIASRLDVSRVLTSGGAVAAGDGIPTIASMVAAAGGRIQIMSGGGVTLAAIPALVASCVDAVHMSATRPCRDHFALDPELVEAAATLLATSRE